MLVIVAPGQGAQAPGFLSPWLELPGTAEQFTAWSDEIGLDLVRYGTTAGADEIRDTAVAQPLLVSAGTAAASALLQPLAAPGVALPADPSLVDAVAGHSVGEFTAAAVAGVLSPKEALALVAERGRGMADAAARTETGMTAVLGGDREEVLEAIEAAGLTPANDNGSGQIVAAGTTGQLAVFAQDPPQRARLRPLEVAGAFHTEHMAPAMDRVRAAAAGLAPNDPEVGLLSNADGAVVHSGTEYIERLVAQITSPVRWEACTRTLADLGVTALIELPPAGTLTSLAKRALRGVELLSVKTPDDLERASTLIKEHAGVQPSAGADQEG